MMYIWIYVTIGIHYIQDATAQGMSDDKPKPGTCPVLPPDTVGTCATECGFDSDCPGVKKCCSNNCAHVCTFPVNPKPGTCPVLPPDTVGTCATECGVDSDCQGVKKCCSNNCAHVCLFPKPELCLTCCGPPPCCNTCITCEIGEPQPNVYCNSRNQLVCAKSFYCKIFSPNEDFGVCCKVPHCPVYPVPNSNCYGHYHRHCSDDSSCPQKTKCCKQGCSYKCVGAV